MIKKFEDVIKEFEALGYEYKYFPNSHYFILIKQVDEDGFCIKSIHIYYRENDIIFDGAFDKEELSLIKRLIEKLEEK